MTISDPEEFVTKIDAMVSPAPEPENAVLTDETRVVRWTGPLFALFSLALLPWTIYIAGSLPAQQVSANYDAAWAGFDVLLALTLAATAYFALRRSRYLATAATATATMLVVDAWFDVLTTPGVQRIESIGLAAFVELPLAAVCIWLSWHTQQLEERRIVLLMRFWRSIRSQVLTLAIPARPPFFVGTLTGCGGGFPAAVGARPAQEAARA